MKSNVAITLFAQMIVVIFKIFMSSYYKYFGYILYQLLLTAIMKHCNKIVLYFIPTKITFKPINL